MCCPAQWGSCCFRPPTNFLTKVGCVGLFLSDLLGTCLLSLRLYTDHASGGPPTFCYKDGWGVADYPCWPVTQGLNNGIGPTSEIITLLCQCQGTGRSNCTLPHKPTVKEVVLPLMGSSPHRTDLYHPEWLSICKFTEHRFRDKWQRAPLKSSDCDCKTRVTSYDSWLSSPWQRFISLLNYRVVFNGCFRTINPQVLSKPTGCMLPQMACFLNDRQFGSFRFMMSHLCNQ